MTSLAQALAGEAEMRIVKAPLSGRKSIKVIPEDLVTHDLC
jgi:hypothetical protein